jgi:hypothetical protein
VKHPRLGRPAYSRSSPFVEAVEGAAWAQTPAGAKSAAVVEWGEGVDAAWLEGLQTAGQTGQRHWSREPGFEVDVCQPTGLRVSVPARLCWDQEPALVQVERP